MVVMGRVISVLQKESKTSVKMEVPLFENNKTILVKATFNRVLEIRCGDTVKVKFPYDTDDK